LVALELYCVTLSKQAGRLTPFLCGDTQEKERREFIHEFRTNPKLNVIGLSKVGDTALDIPEANVIIQVASHFGARRQEAQRLGRILRPKPNPTGGFNAFFYTLVSTDTKEMKWSAKRQQYLIDQGYTYNVRKDVVEKANREANLMRTKQQEMDLLAMILEETDELREMMDRDAKEDREIKAKFIGEDVTVATAGGKGSSSTASGATRRISNISTLSGSGSMGYSEFASKNNKK
jgi:DNA excision repair protein ERCC-3